jgi:uncharacterized protein (TIGR02246 family)
MPKERIAGPGTTAGGIDHVRIAHLAALNRGDPDAAANLFTSDAVQMPPNGPANAGRERIRAWNRAFLETFDVQFALTVDEVHVAAEWAFERGRYSVALAPKPGGPALRDEGKYVTIYQAQTDGTWRIGRHIWNSDRPPRGG